MSPSQDLASVAFVASLLPARFIVENAAALNIRQIVVLNETHERSYAYVAQRIPGVVVTRLRGGALRRGLSVATRILNVKWKGHRVVFFHECCWPAFDIAVDWIRPAGVFAPQVTMSGFEAIDFADVPKAGGWVQRARRAALGLFARRFVIYRVRRDSGRSGYDHFLSWRRYPESIGVSPVSERRTADTLDSPGERSVLIIGGTEPVADDDLRDLYRRLVEVARAEGYTVCIKDHPTHRLNLRCDACAEIDPALPIELIDRRFAFAVSVASTGLLGVGDRKLSVLDLLDGMSDETRQLRRNHLLALPGGDRIEFVSSVEDVRRALRQYQMTA